jgi:hypothetical protein
VGCDLVMSNLLRLSRQHGLRVVATVAHSSTDYQQAARELVQHYDLLLINGEGTFHHDQPKAVAMARAAQSARQHGKLVVLLNTVWQDNSVLNRYLPMFDLIYCRESRSQAAVQAGGHAASVVPDLVFATDRRLIDPAVGGGRGTVVIDSVDRETTLRWARLALCRRYALMTMHEVNYRRLRRRPWLRGGIRLLSGVPIEMLEGDFARQLGRFQQVVSGRFHGCCLALLRDLPVLGIPSNTHKTEGLFEDAGIGAAGLVPRRGCTDLRRRFQLVRSRWPSVQAYVHRAGNDIAAMFAEIGHRAAERRAA